MDSEGNSGSHGNQNSWDRDSQIPVPTNNDTIQGLDGIAVNNMMQSLLFSLHEVM